MGEGRSDVARRRRLGLGEPSVVRPYLLVFYLRAGSSVTVSALVDSQETFVEHRHLVLDLRERDVQPPSVPNELHT